MFIRAVGGVTGGFSKGEPHSLACQIFIQMLHVSTIRHGFTVCVEGNIASGKTNFLEYFKKSSSLVEIHKEPVTKWQNLHGHNALKCPVKVAERSIYSSRYCFVENLHRNKTMADLDYIVLSEWFNWILKSHNIKVDLMVYLRTRPEVVFQRLKKRNRAEEQNITLEHLQALHDLHEEWLIKKSKFLTPCPVLVIDANNSLPQMLKIYEERKSEILFGLKDA